MVDPSLENIVKCSNNCKASTHLSDGSRSNASIPSTIATYSSLPSACVKQRNYLVGRVTRPMGLIDSAEFSRHFPDGHLHLFVGTWNMERCKVPDNLDDFLLPVEEEFLQDIYVVGVQEATTDQEDWEVKLQETLGTTHVLTHSSSHGDLHMAIFLRRDLIWYCSCFEQDRVTTRMIPAIKTKGALAVSFRCFGTSFLFVNAHFRSGENKTKQRIEDYRTICTRLQLPTHAPYNHYQVNPHNATDRFDCVFWFGDLNFRISQPHMHMKSEVEDPSTYNIYEALKCEQLKACMKRGKAFQGFEEAPINFLPTYKFNPCSDVYDTSHKLRVPSYTDRILYKSKLPETIMCHRYNMVSTLRSSDHRPVYTVCVVAMKPCAERFSASAGQFNRDVYLAAARRRAHSMKPQRSYVCAIL